MNYFEELQFISKVKYDNNIAYLLDTDELFVPTEYKVLQAQTNDIFIKCMKLLYNGKIQLFYMTEEFSSLNSMISSIDEDIFITIIMNLFSNIDDVKNNGFLSINNIDISFDHIFIDCKTYKVKLVYLPIYNNKQLYFEKALINNIKEFVYNSPIKQSLKIKQLIDQLENKTLSFDNLYFRLKEDYPSKIEIKKSSNKSQYNNKLKIVSMGAPVYMEFNINKDEFVLGTKKELVDGVIPYNKKISRVHCKINKKENEYTIMDLDSSNGTYVNNIKLQPKHSVIIRNEDIIRLANSNFKVIIE